jgi:hypothetical protein
MAIGAKCPECQTIVNRGDEWAGLSGKCPNCGRVITFLPADPPTPRQLNYAKKLGIDVTANMSKSDVSVAIAKVERENPSVARQRHHVIASRRKEACGPELIESEKNWQKLADDNKWMIAVYESDKSMKVSIVRLNEAIADKNKLVISGEIAVLEHDRENDFSLIDLDKVIDLPFERIKWYEIIDELDVDDVDGFNAAMNRGKEVMRRWSHEPSPVVAPTPPMIEETKLDNAISDCAARISTCRSAAEGIRRQISQNRRKLTYLRLAALIRAPAAKYSLWKFGLLFLSAAVAGIVAFMAFALLVDSYIWALVGAVATAVATGGLILTLLRYPTDSTLAQALTESATQLNNAHERYKTSLADLSKQTQQLESLTRERYELISSITWKRAALLQHNWKAMRDNEWEDYLVEVFTALGANARRIGRAGDQGVDLIVEGFGRRIAVQAKGYYNAVNNKAVQEAVTGKAHHGCCTAAVITNSHFRRSALELAESNNCVLIGEEQFPDFVMGTVDYFPNSRISGVDTETEM